MKSMLYKARNSKWIFMFMHIGLFSIIVGKIIDPAIGYYYGSLIGLIIILLSIILSMSTRITPKPIRCLWNYEVSHSLISAIIATILIVLNIFMMLFSYDAILMLVIASISIVSEIVNIYRVPRH